jgi:hypothetical protein
MKQTALTYLIDKLELKVLSQHMPFVDNIISEAIEMEREQIAEAFDHVDSNLDDGLHYYEQTFEDESNA